MKVPAISLLAASLVFGLGAAIVDSARDGCPRYYFGWFALAGGVSVLFVSASRGALGIPYLGVFLLTAFGWWNVFWTWAVLSEHRAYHVYPQVSLVNLKGFLPSKHHAVILPTWVFVLTTVVAIAVPTAAVAVHGLRGRGA